MVTSVFSLGVFSFISRFFIVQAKKQNGEL